MQNARMTADRSTTLRQYNPLVENAAKAAEAAGSS